MQCTHISGPHVAPAHQPAHRRERHRLHPRRCRRQSSAPRGPWASRAEQRSPLIRLEALVLWRGSFRAHAQWRDCSSRDRTAEAPRVAARSATREPSVPRRSAIRSSSGIDASLRSRGLCCQEQSQLAASATAVQQRLVAAALVGRVTDLSRVRLSMCLSPMAGWCASRAAKSNGRSSALNARSLVEPERPSKGGRVASDAAVRRRPRYQANPSDVAVCRAYDGNAKVNAELGPLAPERTLPRRVARAFQKCASQ